MFYRSRYRSEPEIVDIQEEEFSDRVGIFYEYLLVYECINVKNRIYNKRSNFIFIQYIIVQLQPAYYTTYNLIDYSTSATMQQ